jgi:hypothetical protein
VQADDVEVVAGGGDVGRAVRDPNGGARFVSVVVIASSTGASAVAGRTNFTRRSIRTDWTKARSGSRIGRCSMLPPTAARASTKLLPISITARVWGGAPSRAIAATAQVESISQTPIAVIRQPEADGFSSTGRVLLAEFPEREEAAGRSGRAARLKRRRVFEKCAPGRRQG